MTKAQLIKAMALKANLTNVQAEKALDALTEVATEELKTVGNEIVLVGLGKLKSTKRAGRTITSFGVRKDVPERTAIKFVVSSVLKAQL